MVMTATRMATATNITTTITIITTARRARFVRAPRAAQQPDSVLFIENVGNLVCPALWDLGEDAKVAILSVTEGEDKPLKYPDMFAAARADDRQQDRPAAVRAVRRRALHRIRAPHQSGARRDLRVGDHRRRDRRVARLGSAHGRRARSAAARIGELEAELAALRAAASRRRRGMTLRRERLPRAWGADTVLATGAWLKNAACVYVDGDVYWSPLHGDLDDPRHCVALEASVASLVDAARQAGRPVRAIAHDLHPDFHSSRLAVEWASASACRRSRCSITMRTSARSRPSMGSRSRSSGSRSTASGSAPTAPPGAANCSRSRRTAGGGSGI
jgi:hypothetical protein